MGRSNPTNPYSTDPSSTAKDVSPPIAKGRVENVKGMPDNGGYHTVRVRLYRNNNTFIAPVLTPMLGSVWIPRRKSDVAVMFSKSGKPWVIGAWYAPDRVERGNIDIPDYDPGDIRVGNESGSHMTVNNDGSIHIETADKQAVNISKQTAIAYLNSSQSIAGDDNYYQVNFDTEEDNKADLFDPTTGTITLLHGGEYTIEAEITFLTPGQNNRYTIAVFVDGTIIKRRAVQSSVNNEISPTISAHRRFDGGEEIDIRIRQNSGSPHDIEGAQESNHFTIKRDGI